MVQIFRSDMILPNNSSTSTSNPQTLPTYCFWLHFCNVGCFISAQTRAIMEYGILFIYLSGKKSKNCFFGCSYAKKKNKKKHVLNFILRILKPSLQCEKHLTWCRAKYFDLMFCQNILTCCCVKTIGLDVVTNYWTRYGVKTVCLRCNVKPVKVGLVSKLSRCCI